MTSVLLLVPLLFPQAPPSGFVALFDGQTLKGWNLVGASGSGVKVREGAIVFPPDGGGNLLTERQYENFVLRFEYRLEAGGNNGVAIRAPLQGDAAYLGIECQILDDPDPMYQGLKPWQYHSSLYRLVAAKRGAPKPAGQWNSEEITANGRQFTVKVNGKTTIRADLNRINDPEMLRMHPGMLRDRGYVGFCGHGPREVQIRRVFIKELPPTKGTPEPILSEGQANSSPIRQNVPPPGFRALFNGRDLRGWKGLVADPPARAKMSPEKLKEEQKKADEQMRAHWKVVDGALVYDGKGNSLCTDRDYGDFEMIVDWKIHPGGDSGIYLRGSPQVQIWDRPEGSGGLYNNQKNPSNPLTKADRAPGEWNRFRILMVGEKVHIFLNGILIVNNVTLENYWQREIPIYPSGQIELQHHGDQLMFRNVFLREIRTDKPTSTG